MHCAHQTNVGQETASSGASRKPRHRSRRCGAARAARFVAAFALAGCSAPDRFGLFSSVGAVAPTPGADAGAVMGPPASAAAAPSAANSDGAVPAIGSRDPIAGTAPPPARDASEPMPVDAGATAPGDPISGDPAPADPVPSDPVPADPAPSVPPQEPVGIVFTDASEACVFPEDAPPAATLFSGQLEDDACRINLDAPYGTFWYSYQDSDGDPAVSQGARAPACADDTCSLRVQGPVPGSDDFSVYGAGVGFQLALDGGELDASRFSGLQYWVRGNIQGTRDTDGSSSPQTLRLKIVTATDRLGDDFGMYCRIDPQSWTLCRQDFSELARDGFASTLDPRVDVFDPRELVRIEFEFPLFRDAAGSIPTPLGFDIELAAISFF
jgi:hypothetical protein